MRSHIKDLFQKTGFNQKAAESAVFKVQQAIVMAFLAGNMQEVRRLQLCLVRMYEARALAVLHVVSNTGAKTPGVDGVVWNTPEQIAQAIKDLRAKQGAAYKAKPVKRVMIPKANGGERPLGIPTMFDRAMQALWLLAVIPIAETTADSHSYGFREKRSTQDAVDHIQQLLGNPYTKLRWILDADIKGFFDNINHQWILENIPIERNVLMEFIKAGFIHKNVFESTDLGVPQGGVISPVISNMVLDGLQKYIIKHVHKDAVLIRYADDFIVCTPTKSMAEKALKVVGDFLKKRGVWLNMDKTKICSVEEGFNFLGFWIKEFKDSRYAKGLKQGALLVKPQPKKVIAYKAKIKDIVYQNWGEPMWIIIKKLNPVLQGWANYYRKCQASQTFKDVSQYIFTVIWNMLRKTHPKVPVKELKKKYYTTVGNNQWTLFGKTPTHDTITLFQISEVNILRHKRKQHSNPFIPEDPDLKLKFFNEMETRYLQNKSD